MLLAQSDRKFEYLPLYQSFACELDDEMPPQPWSDAVGWSTAIRQATDLIEPDVATVQGTGPLYEDLRAADGGSPDDPGFGNALGSASEALLETIRIVDDVLEEPVVCVVPGPVTLCAERFGRRWLTDEAVNEFAALDALHGASQLLTDVVRELDGAASGLIVDEPAVQTALESGLTLDDILLEAGAVFNVADHHGLTIIGRFPESVHEPLPTLADQYDAVLFKELSPATLETILGANASVGSGFNNSIWELTNAEFKAEVRTYIETLPERFILSPRIPGTAPPVRVRQLGEFIDEA